MKKVKWAKGKFFYFQTSIETKTHIETQTMLKRKIKEEG